ncbi:MAG TPA: thiamine pyrophosphate-binding protein [Candidatus Acidoferrales bacterium]|nr:thiamine pyrophosphate-binding protein [Candidatus Acidoferrales bacterium]
MEESASISFESPYMGTIGGYLIERLQSLGVDHVFGVPGDYIITFFKQLSDSKIQLVTTCDELTAGYAADAYARIRGLGAICVTYCVGGLKVVNAAAQAFAEKSPIIVITGAPGMNERTKNALLHHTVRDFDTQQRVFDEVTIASTVLSDPNTACHEIDRVLSQALQFKRPVYIELPRDMVFKSIGCPHVYIPQKQVSDQNKLRSALAEAALLINRAKQPVIIAGVELHRFGLVDKLLTLAEKTAIPVAATILSKSVIGEYHPLYMGVYEGAMGHESVRTYVESSDCLILLGAPLTDVDLGQYTAHIDQERAIYVTSEQLTIGYHSYLDVRLQDFLDGLLKMSLAAKTLNFPHPPTIQPFHLIKGKKIKVKRLFERLNWILSDNTVVITDVGDALFGGLDLVVHSKTEFLAPAYYLSLGFAVPACIGAQLANPQLRPLVLVGDGAFQMSGMEVSTIVRLKMNPIIMVLNNKGYGTERPLQDGPFNDLQLWQYSQIPKILGEGIGLKVETEDELEDALETAQANVVSFTLIDVQLDPHDKSSALERLTQRLAMKTHEFPVTDVLPENH